MSEKQHTVGTYNMSFMSDLTIPIGPGMAWASEGAFLARLQVEKEPDKIRRSYWTNAKNLLKTFIEQKKPSVVGLQEMNVTATDSGTGTDAINKMLEEVNKTGTTYLQECANVTINNAGVSIIYDTAQIGTKVASKIVDNKNPITKNASGEPVSGPGGRPILMLLTELDGKKYLSVSMHGAQDPKLRLDMNKFNEYMVDNNKKFLEGEIQTFLGEGKYKITDASQLSGVFITGDFNDRYDGIKNIDILGETTKATYSGKAPKACCYNWDSSCPDADVEKDFETDIETDLKNNYKTCTEPASMKDAAGAKLPLPGDRGNTKNYRYAGDKVFVLNPTTNANLKIFRPEGFDDVSTQSDHELVYYEPSPSVEGGRKSRRASRKNRKGKRGKSRRRNRKSRR
jgi:hypothetical protein